MKPAQQLIQRADDILEGRSTTVEDWRDALELYVTAGNLGSGLAFARVARMYAVGVGVKKHPEKAISYFKKAFSLQCYHDAPLFITTYCDLNEIQNALKIFRIYTENPVNSDGADADNWLYMFVYLYGDIKNDYELMSSLRQMFVDSVAYTFIRFFGDPTYYMEETPDDPLFFQVSRDYVLWAQQHGLPLPEPGAVFLERAWKDRPGEILITARGVLGQDHITELDWEVLMEDLKQAAALGSPAGTRLLGYVYSLPANPYHNQFQALEYYRKALEAGETTAWLNFVEWFLGSTPKPVYMDYIPNIIGAYRSFNGPVQDGFDLTRTLVRIIFLIHGRNDAVSLASLAELKPEMQKQFALFQKSADIELGPVFPVEFGQAIGILRAVGQDQPNRS